MQTAYVSKTTSLLTTMKKPEQNFLFMKDSNLEEDSPFLAKIQHVSDFFVSILILYLTHQHKQLLLPYPFQLIFP